MMKISPFLCLIVISLSCRKDVSVGKVFTNFQIKDKNLPADGSSTTEVSVELPIDSDPAKRGVAFTATNGSIVNALQGKLIVKADFDNGKLVAKASFKASLSDGKAYVTITPELPNAYKDFSLKDSLTLEKSLPATIKIETSAPAVRINYQSEIFLRAVVQNDKGKNVSTGAEVRFSTHYSSGAPFDARYRNLNTKTADSSSVSTFFSVGNIPLGDFIVTAQLYENNVAVPISGQLTLTITN
jgi:hypothetical protein